MERRLRQDALPRPCPRGRPAARGDGDGGENEDDEGALLLLKGENALASALDAQKLETFAFSEAHCLRVALDENGTAPARYREVARAAGIRSERGVPIFGAASPHKMMRAPDVDEQRVLLSRIPLPMVSGFARPIIMSRALPQRLSSVSTLSVQNYQT